MKTSKGVLDVPNTIRIQSNAEIKRLYKAYLESNGLLRLLMSDATMDRLLKGLPATRRHSMQCVDNFLADSQIVRGLPTLLNDVISQSFETLHKHIDTLVKWTMMTKEEGEDLQYALADTRQYLNTDFKLHVKNESSVR